MQNAVNLFIKMTVKQFCSRVKHSADWRILDCIDYVIDKRICGVSLVKVVPSISSRVTNIVYCPQWYSIWRYEPKNKEIS